MWGLLNDGALYRIEPEGYLPVRLMSPGAIFYWENGFAHLRMQRDSAEAAGFEYGHASYLSHNVLSEIVPASFKADDTKSPSAKFKKAWPAYADLLDRIGEGADGKRKIILWPRSSENLDGRITRSGTLGATRVSAPPRPTVYPSPRSFSYAITTVLRETPRSELSERVDGRREPGSTMPSQIALRISIGSRRQ